MKIEMCIFLFSNPLGLTYIFCLHYKQTNIALYFDKKKTIIKHDFHHNQIVPV
jgi:hypothetical protein